MVLEHRIAAAVAAGFQSQPTTEPPINARAILTALRRRLERFELAHLREHALDLAERLERAEAELERALDTAEFWHAQAMELLSAVDDPAYASHRCVGLTKSGELLVVRDADQVAV
jgi:hypothetical protein